MKYKIELMGYPQYVRMISLGKTSMKQIRQYDSLESLWDEFEENGREYDVESEYVTCDDSFKLEVKNMKGDTVYETESIDDIIHYPYCDEDDNDIIPDGYEFKGVGDGYYLVNQDTMKGSCWEFELEADGDFDPSRLYLVKSDVLNDEFCGNDCFPMGVIYYQKSDNVNLDTDRVEMVFVSDNGDYGCSLSIVSVKEQDWWKLVRE